MKNKMGHKKIYEPDKVRGDFDIFVGHRCKCQYCGFDGSRSAEDWVQLQIDHLIPQAIAGPDANDSLNKITSCYYCNWIKKDFDPAYGKFTKINNQSIQQKLVKIASEEIQKRKDRNWAYAGGLECSYQFMLGRILKK
jgi:hypothetical protein